MSFTSKVISGQWPEQPAEAWRAEFSRAASPGPGLAAHGTLHHHFWNQLLVPTERAAIPMLLLLLPAPATPGGGTLRPRVTLTCETLRLSSMFCQPKNIRWPPPRARGTVLGHQRVRPACRRGLGTCSARLTVKGGPRTEETSHRR